VAVFAMLHFRPPFGDRYDIATKRGEAVSVVQTFTLIGVTVAEISVPEQRHRKKELQQI